MAICEELIYAHAKIKNNIFYFTLLEKRDLASGARKSELIEFYADRGEKPLIEITGEKVNVFGIEKKDKDFLKEFNDVQENKIKAFFNLPDEEKKDLLIKLLDYIDSKTEGKVHEKIEELKRIGKIKIVVDDSGDYCDEYDSDDDDYRPDDPYMYGDIPYPLSD